MESSVVTVTPAETQSPDTTPPAALADATPESTEAIESSHGKRDIPKGQGGTQVPGQILDPSEKAVSFLKKIEPFKVLMSNELRSEMEDVAAWAIECKRVNDAQNSSPAKPRGDEVPRWDFEVKKKSMESWKMDILVQRAVPPVPLLETYYRSLGPGDSLEAQTLPGGLSDLMADQKNLQRIKITSHILHSELELLTSSIILFPVIIAPPYKLLLEYLPQMKIKLADLRHELAEATSDPGASGNGDATSDSDGSQSSHEENKMPSTQAGEDFERRREDLRMRIAHWETLTGFIDRSLGDLVKMRTQIADGTLDKIAFDDLWHLFRPGDLVLSKGPNQHQLFKVHFVNGSQVRRRNLTAEEDTGGHCRHFDNVGMGTGTWSPLKLDVFRMNFDGVRMGPEDQAPLAIKHYTGKKLVTDLSVFPVRFHPEKDKFLARLEERGRKFMASAGHRFYEGLTLSSPWARGSDGLADKAEDIVSEIFVDFEAFFRAFQHLEPEIGRFVSSGQDPTETSEFMLCGAITKAPPPHFA
ncbi:hypothetical protein C8A00DRAFT_32421, partial [Chaetomidium leptoderma]